jgi:single-strand DNA-binding protein
MNSIVLVGRLTKDPELKYTQEGVAVAQFTLAVDRPFKNKDGSRETDFINIVVYRKQAENCAEYLSKGKMAGVEGRLQIRTYDDKNGQRRWMTEVVANNVSFLSPKDSGQNGGQNEQGFAYAEAPLEEIPF